MSYTQYNSETDNPMGVTDQTGMDAGTGNGIAQPHQTPWGGYPTPREIAAAGMFEGVSPHLFTAGVDVMSRQLGNRTLMHWVEQLCSAGQNRDTHASAAQDLQGVSRPLTQVSTHGVLQLMRKKQKNTGKPVKEEAAGGTPKATSETGMAAVLDPQAALPRAEPAIPATPGEQKKKKKPRVQVALNTLRAEGLEEFKGYIEAEIGEPELLRTLVERISRARDLGDNKDRALRTIEKRMGALAPESIPATARAAGSGQGQVMERAIIAPVNSAPGKREKELFESCLKGHAARIKHLLRFGNIDINIALPDGTFLCRAAYSGRTAVVRELLSIPGIDVNLAQRYGLTPLYFAAQQGHVEVARLLLAARGINVNLAISVGAVPLYIASQQGHEEIVRLLLENPDININARKPNGSTSLLIAAQHNFPGIVELLLKHGANLNLEMFKEGTTPLIIAAARNHIDVVRLLLQEPSIQINHLTEEGLTPLCAAIQDGHREITGMLLAKGADPNILNGKGTSPLILACLYRNTATFEMLLNAGADIDLTVNMPGGEKFTVYEIARLMDYGEAVALLEAYCHNKPAQAVLLERPAPEDGLEWSTPPTSPPPVWSTPPTTPPPDWSTSPVTITPDESTTPTTTQAFPPPYTMPVTQPGETASALAVVPGKADTGTMKLSDTAPVATVPEPPAPAASGSRLTRKAIQSPLGTAKNALVQEVLKKLDNNTLEPLEGIRLMIEARAAADMDMLSVFYNRLAGMERQRGRTRPRKPVRPAADTAGAQSMAPNSVSPRYALGDKANLDADAVEGEIRKHLDQSRHRFISQAVNDMEFGRGKPTTGYPGLLHASAGIPGVGSCSVFYYTDATQPLIRIVGIGHHLDAETYRLDYTDKALSGVGSTLRLS